MSDQLLFLLKLQDQVSPGMKAAAAVTDTTAARMQRSMDMVAMNTLKTNRALGQLHSTIKSIDTDRFADKIVRGLREAVIESRKLDREMDSISKKSRGGSGGIGGLLGAGSLTRLGLIGAGAAGVYKGVDFVGDAIGSAMKRGQVQTSFEVLTGSAATGQNLTGDINKMVTDTIMGPELFQNAQTMLAFGVSIDKVIPNLKMLGDVSMGDKEKMSALTLAFSQVQAAGRLTGQDLLQFVNAGFNPLQIISEKTGVSLAVLRKRMEDGGISADMVTKAFQDATSEGGKFHGMLDKIAQTPAGKMAQLSGQFDDFKTRLGQSLMPLAEIGIKGLNKLLEIANMALPYITEGVAWVVAGFNELIHPTGMWAEYVNIAKSYIYAAYQGAVYVFQKVWHIVSGLIEWISKSQLIKDIFWAIGKVGEAVWWVIKKIADAIAWVFDNIVKPILNAIEWVYNKVKSLLGLGEGKAIEIKGSVENKTIASTATLPQAPVIPVDPTTANAPAAAPKAGNGAYQGLNTGGKADNINSGGQRSIIINIGKQVEKLEVHSINVKEGIEEIAGMVRAELLRIVQSINGNAVTQ